jgi:rubrerythrin
MAQHEGFFARLVGDHYLRRLAQTARGRAFVLGFMADAEESDEQRVFDTMLARVEDPKIRRVIAKHVADEERHASMLHACAARQGVGAEPVPDQLRIVLRIDRMLGGFAAKLVAGERGVWEAYALLQVIEERAVSHYPAIARALAAVDPESAATVMAVVRDEQRHVKYARAISRRLAPSAAVLEHTLQRLRQVEAQAFADHGNAFLRHAVDRGLVATSLLERFFLWRVLAPEPRAAASRMVGGGWDLRPSAGGL